MVFFHEREKRYGDEERKASEYIYKGSIEKTQEIWGVVSLELHLTAENASVNFEPKITSISRLLNAWLPCGTYS